MLFVAYDLPAPAPLNGARPIASAFAAALVLDAFSEQALATADVTLTAAAGRDVSHGFGQEFERLRLDNPAARLLPVLAGARHGAPRHDQSEPVGRSTADRRG